jgi:hypothetical protein
MTYGIEAAPFLLVAQRLNQLRYRVIQIIYDTLTVTTKFITTL